MACWMVYGASIETERYFPGINEVDLGGGCCVGEYKLICRVKKSNRYSKILNNFLRIRFNIVGNFSQDVRIVRAGLSCAKFTERRSR